MHIDLGLWGRGGTAQRHLHLLSGCSQAQGWLQGLVEKEGEEKRREEKGHVGEIGKGRLENGSVGKVLVL